MKCVIFGAGAWGTAVAIHLARLGHYVYLVPRREEQVVQLRADRQNKRYLAGLSFPDNLNITQEVDAPLADADLVMFGCPTKGLRATCRSVASKRFKRSVVAITLCKGLEADTFKRPTEIVGEELKDVCLACLSGPTYAREFAENKLSAMVLGCSNDEAGKAAQQWINGGRVRIYRTTDLIGVELGGSLKNIYSIGAGIVDGLGLGDNAKAAYFTRVLSEMSSVGSFLGGREKTFYGLSGLGDLLATGQGKWSRNRVFGESFAKGDALEILTNNGTTVEGYVALHGVFNLIKDKLEAPILSALYNSLYEQKPLEGVIEALMQRSLKVE